MNETAIGVNATNPAVLISAVVARHTPNVVWYSISTDFGQTWSAPQQFTPPSSCFTVMRSTDPSVTSDSQGNLFLGATAWDGVNLEWASLQGLFVGRMPAGQSALTGLAGATPCAVCCPQDPYRYGDRSRIVFGPGPNGGPEWGLFGYYRNLGGYNVLPFGAASIPQPGETLGLVWNYPFPITLGPLQLQGTGALHPTILPSGRAVVASADVPPTSNTYEVWPTIVYYSDNQGGLWQQGIDPVLTTLNTYREISNSTDPQIDHTATGVVGAFSSDIAPDPAHPNTLYAVQSGRMNNDPHSPNSDLYFFKSSDGGLSFPLNQRLRLTDDLLPAIYAPAGSHQFDPAICVDAFGGINVLYYQSTSSGQVQGFYLRLTNYNADNPTSMGRFVTPLSPVFTIPAPGSEGAAVPNFIGDYQGIATSGCFVYACFMSTHTGHYNFYVARIFLPECVPATDFADFNHDSVVDSADVFAYLDAYTASLPAADVTQDQTINASDFIAFITAYTAATSTTP